MRKASRPTIYDVARVADVSPATVSRVINGRRIVRPETRARVLAAADALGFHAAAAARSLKTARTRTVALLIGRPQYPLVAGLFGYRVIAGLEMALGELGYDLIVIGSDGDATTPGVPERTIRRLLERRPDATVVLGPTFRSEFVTRLIGQAGPMVLVDNRLPGVPLDSVTADDEVGAGLAADHLIRVHGYRSLAFVGGHRGWWSTKMRLRGVRKAVAMARGRLLVKHAAETTIAAGERAVREVLERRPEVGAIVAVNDAIALGALRAAKACGRRVPDDLAVTGFDDIALAELVEPPLTTVHVPVEMLGARAAQLVVDRLVGRREDGSTRTEVVPVGLVVRGTCGCTVGDDTPRDDAVRGDRRLEVDAPAQPIQVTAGDRSARRVPGRRRFSATVSDGVARMR